MRRTKLVSSSTPYMYMAQGQFKMTFDGSKLRGIVMVYYESWCNKRSVRYLAALEPQSIGRLCLSESVCKMYSMIPRAYFFVALLIRYWYVFVQYVVKQVCMVQTTLYSFCLSLEEICFKTYMYIVIKLLQTLYTNILDRSELLKSFIRIFCPTKLMEFQVQQCQTFRLAVT